MMQAVSNSCQVTHDHGYAEHHAYLKSSPGQHLPAIAFVRHPLTWYPSYWNFRMRTGWKDDHAIDRDCASTDFNKFASRVAERHPGWLCWYLEQWVGTEDQPAAFVGRFEQLQDDLIRGLRQFGEPVDEDALRATQPQNRGAYRKLPALWDGAVAMQVCESESRFLKRFYSNDFTRNQHMPIKYPDDLCIHRNEGVYLKSRKQSKNGFLNHLVSNWQGIEYPVNETAALVWRCCEESIKVGDLIQVLTTYFPESASLESDIRGILVQFQIKGLLTFSQEP